uniref:Uncharacterized protein n=1 Tax=Zonotrichia albicollis TaxID=44394 RepID=A0A8D2ML72_ZONAL
GNVFLLPQQPQQDVLLILWPAINVSVLQPGSMHVCYLFGIWEKHRDESEVHTSLLYKFNLHLEQNKNNRGWFRGGRSGTVRYDCAQGCTRAQEGEGGEKHRAIKNMKK